MQNGAGGERLRQAVRSLLRTLLACWRRRWCLQGSCLERTDGKIAQPQIGIAPLLPDAEQRPVQRLTQQVVALAYGDPDALAEKTTFDERAAGERAAFGGIGAIDPEGKRDPIAKDEIDLAPSERQPQRVVVGIRMQFGVGEHRLEIGLVRRTGDGADLLAFEIFGTNFRHYGVAP